MSESRFIENVKEARDNGYAAVCAECGVGVNGDEFDWHEDDCQMEVTQAAAEAAFVARMTQARRTGRGDG